ncbi:MAG TPA: helix-turn-helix domain-containing protein [Tepidisphaeraceae bacterium]|jgi:antitoxin component HigA of HigAB toxin-antitoxin module|nr:helix-turn-helix domain-containing protein [Tepidisphaeraceae bacterium]
MSKTASHLPKQMPRTFDELNGIFPLRPMHDQVDLENAHEVMDRLAVINKPTRDQADYLDTLVLLTEAFDKENNDAALAAAEKISGLEMLKYVMENTEMTQAALAGILGVTEAAASMILKGTRSITAEHARTLGRRFKLNPGAFIR